MSRHGDGGCLSGGAPDGEFRADCFRQSFLAHRLNDAGGAEYGKPADNAETRIEGFFCKVLAAGDRDGDKSVRRKPSGQKGASYRFFDHPARHTVDRRGAHRLVEAGKGNASHAFAALDADSRLVRETHAGIDKDTVCDVGIVPGILPYGTGASFSPRCGWRISACTVWPPGVRIEAQTGSFPVSREAAADDASAAQVPVVIPQRSPPREGKAEEASMK